MKKAKDEKTRVKTGFERSDEPFLDAILDAPQDDPPRLALADRLLERADPRGEFIVVQCLLARLDREDRRWTPEYGAALKREEQLLSRHYQAWTSTFGIEGLRSKFRRGFMGSIGHIHIGWLRDKWERFAREPLDSIAITDSREGTNANWLEDVQWLASEPAAGRLSTLRLLNPSIAELDFPTVVAAFAEPRTTGDPFAWAVDSLLPHEFLLPALRGVNHRWGLLDAPHVQVLLAGAPTLRSFECMRTGGDAATAIAQTTMLPALEELVVVRQGETWGDMRASLCPLVGCAFAAGPVLPQLRRLRASLTLDAELARALAVRAVRLDDLQLDAEVVPAALDVFLTGPLSNQLRALSLVGGAAPPSATAIARAPFARLERLHLIGFAIDDAAARALVAFPRLWDVAFRSCAVSPEAQRAMRARWPNARIDHAG